MMRILIFIGFFIIFLAALTAPAVPQEYQIPGAVDSEIYDVPTLPVTIHDGDYFYRGMYVDVSESDTHFADVTYFNVIVPKGAATDITFVDIRGLNVQVFMEYGKGDIPDTMRVIPPAGFVAIPQELSVEEDTTGIIEIHELLLG